MYKTQIFLFTAISILCLAGPIANAGPFRQDSGPDGIVSMEAENFDDNTPKGEHRWVLVGPTDGFTGDAGMQAQPNILVNNTTDYVTKSPRLDYKINFVKTGTHYIWLRVWANDGSDDSCHAGLDFQAIATSDGIDGFDNVYVWTNSTIDGPVPTIEVANTGLHTFNIWMREDGCIVDKIVLTTNPSYAPEDNGPPESIREPDTKAADPHPADGQTDVSRDVELSWTPGDFARTHDIYFGTSFNDVNNAGINNPLNVLAKQGQDANTFAPGRLDFEQTYFWRIDEVNAPTAPATFKGFVWSFKTESFAYAITGEKITVTASGKTQNQVPGNTVNELGLNTANLQHSNDPATMWLSDKGGPGTAWIQYEFDKPYKLNEMWVWNYNGPSIFSGFGIKEAVIEYSPDGTNWMRLGDVHEFKKGSGTNTYIYNTIINFENLAVMAVKITANSSWGGAMYNQYGLSEVRFMQIPVHAAGPDPEDGAADVARNVTLSWRPGREAEEHKVYLSADRQAVIDGSAPVVTVSQAKYGSLSLDLGTSYFWRIDEVNNAKTPSIWQGDIWSFTTQEYLVVDDFESYNDIAAGQEGSNLVYETWIDGYVEPPAIRTNGSTIGYTEGLSMQTETVHTGRQSVPFSYNNTVASYSQATADMSKLGIGRDWTLGAPEKLIIWFYGDPNNAAQQMYVKVNDTKVTCDADLTQTQWQETSVDLASLGINLSNVTQLVIGFERIGTTGGSGMVFIDDIMLYSLLNE